MNTIRQDRMLVDDEDRTYEVVNIDGMPGVYSVLTFEGEGKLGRVIGGFECISTNTEALEDEALLVIQESTAQ